MADSKCRWQSPEDWSEWSDWLAAGLDARNRWRLPILLTGMLLASGRRTVTTWLRAAGVSDDYQDFYYFLTSIGRNSKKIASQLTVLVLRTLPLPARVLLVIDDSPTRRYGPHVEGADIHRNPAPGPVDQPFLYGQRSPLRGGARVTISLALRPPQWRALALPLSLEKSFNSHKAWSPWPLNEPNFHTFGEIGLHKPPPLSAGLRPISLKVQLAG